jgi:hypothetical protein
VRPWVDPRFEFGDKSWRICLEACEKEENWKESSVISPASSDSGLSKTLSFSVRDRKGQDKHFSARVIIISQTAFWSFCGSLLFVVASILLVVLAGKNDSAVSRLARRILFQVLPDSGWASRVNLPIQIVTSLEPGLWWCIRPVLIQAASSVVEEWETDKAVAAATYRDDNATLVIYECPRDESSARALSVSRIVAKEALASKEFWRLPVTVRLDEISDADVKKALMQTLQPAFLDNATFADRLLRSRRIVFLFLGSDQLGSPDHPVEKSPIPSILQTARGQASRSVLLTAVAPAVQISFIPKIIKGVSVPASAKPESNLPI